MSGPLLSGRLLRYVGTGGTAAVVDIGLFACLVRAGLIVPLAACLSFAMAAVVNYWLTSRFVFGHRRSVAGFAQFLAAALIGLAINVSVTTLAAALLPIPPVVAKLIGVGVAFGANFLLNALIVFRPRTR
ncbi:GtrA family protein [Sphingomonas nostoxanthinifaciens]|uniref:GtrA family protein n=1 Tax=Sphingomonas nostoxanthinifaciens TaxID=2872652 RepID=UPI001CC2161E|nr:GtrA family protein [Sphingomonas nostoxanthinifaciens]UAK23417.1 GtrA family protein [Sphingomonas nostoxanthinifaciens]